MERKDVSGGPPRRLDSWKQIARYLKRDVRTLRRWRRQGVDLPVHRIPGGRSVYAYTQELDAWLLGGAIEDATESGNRAPIPRRRWATVAGLGLLGAIAVGAALRGSRDQVVTVTAEGDRLAARDGMGQVLWTLEHPTGRIFNPEATNLSTISGAWPRSGGGILVANNTYTSNPDSRSVGELFRLSEVGDLLWVRSVQENLRMGETDYSGPWVSSLLYLPQGSDLLIWGTHHATWWPSLTLALDENGAVAGRFVNSGWVTSANSLPSPDGARLLLGGISNSRAGAMLAVLPTLRFFGKSPEAQGSDYSCEACPDGAPLMYVVFPPTHVNAASGLPYNQTTSIDVSESGISVMVREGPSPTDLQWIYDLSAELELLRATPGDSYWPQHRLLEVEGKLDHSVEDCPERESVDLLVWTPEDGWRSVPTKTGVTSGVG
jgi:hypothetical protein